MTFPLEYPFFNVKECREIKDYAYKKEIELKDTTIKTPETYNNSITTNHYDQYNFFQDNPKYVDRFVNFLKETECPIGWPIICQSWVNIYRKGDGIGWHYHFGSGYSFNIFIDGDPLPGPIYLLDSEVKEYELKSKNFMNKTGYIQIFPSHMYHKVDPINSERITVGGTIHFYNDIHLREVSRMSFNNKEKHGYIILG